MARVSPFHSYFEARKAPYQRVYHSNDACPTGRAIPERERQAGTGGHRQCLECEKLDRTSPGANRWI